MIFEKVNNTEKKIEPPMSSSHVLSFLLESCCYSCQEKWIGYQCNCYFISNEVKAWEDSRDFCVSHNSSLLQIQNRNELASI